MNGAQRDAVLVASARRGDVAAFEALVDRHVDRGYRIASALLGAPDADAAVVDASLAAWRHLPRLHDPSEFGAWFDGILIAACRMRARGSDAALPRVWAGASQRRDPSGDDGLEVGEALARLETAFDRLDPTDRIVLVLHEVAGEAPAHIARAIHEPEGVVRVRLAESRATLLAALGAGA